MSTITHVEWKRQNIGKIIDFDNAFGGQCVDVARDHASKVDGVSDIESVHGAADFFNNYDRMPNLRTAYHRIAYQEGLVPPEGAKVVWRGTSSNGNFGHIAVVDTANQTSQTILEQCGFDNPTREVGLGTSRGLVERATNYNDVLGWLVLRENRNQNTRTVPANGNTPPANARIASSDRNAQNGDYWFNQSTNRWMLLTNGRWSNI